MRSTLTSLTLATALGFASVAGAVAGSASIKPVEIKPATEFEQVGHHKYKYRHKGHHGHSKWHNHWHCHWKNGYKSCHWGKHKKWGGHH